MEKLASHFSSVRLSCIEYSIAFTRQSTHTHHSQFNENIEHLYFNTKLCVCPNKSGPFKTNVTLEFANFRVKTRPVPVCSTRSPNVYFECDNPFLCSFSRQLFHIDGGTVEHQRLIHLATNITDLNPEWP